MIILFWVFSYILFLSLTVILLRILIRHPQTREAWRTIWEGFQDGLQGCGLKTKRKYPVDLWVWETMADEEVCDDCQERAAWPPMDIADWMKEGLPGTGESETECADHCRCRLVPYNPQKKSTYRHRQN